MKNKRIMIVKITCIVFIVIVFFYNTTGMLIAKETPAAWFHAMFENDPGDIVALSLMAFGIVLYITIKIRERRLNKN